MANTQLLSRRIKTAKNIKQITKAMEMVSASKMRRSQAQALGSRPYASKLQQTLRTIAQYASSSNHPLLDQNQSGEAIALIISTDKSLAGSLNTNLFRHTAQLISTQFNKNPKVIIVGQKAKQFALSMGYQIEASFEHLPDPISFNDTLPLSHLLIDHYLDKSYRSVKVYYMDFVSTLVQRFTHSPLLPIAIDQSDTNDEANLNQPYAEYMFEPSSPEVLNWLLPYYIELTVFQTLIEAKAAEHSARMVAMKNASDNASEIINDLTLIYNRTRQESITSEILDIATASAYASS